MSRAKPAADRSNERRTREMRMRAFSSAPAAVRMRLHRKRRREGTHYIRIPLESFEIEGLIRLKVLPKAHREDADALQAVSTGRGGGSRPVAKPRTTSTT